MPQMEVLIILKDNAWLLGFVSFAAAAIWVAWQNRGAEKVRSAIVAGVAVGFTLSISSGRISDIWLRLTIIASAALASMLLVALKDEARRVEFPTIFVYESDTKRPLEALSRIYEYRFCGRTSLGSPQFIVSRMENAIGADDTEGDLYFDVLLRMVVDLLFGMYRNAWDLKIVRRFQYSSRTIQWEPHQGAPPPKFIAREEFRELFPESRALRVEDFPATGDKLAVPSGTRLDGKTEFHGDRPHNRILSLKNPFVEVTVGLTFSSFTRIGIGDLGLLLGLSQEESEKFSTYSCEVNLSAKFKRLRSGHPEMERYRRWVDVMFQEIQENFDSGRHWERGKDWYTMKKLSEIKEDA